MAVIATRQQLWTPANAREKEPSLLDTAKEIVGEGGVTALWTGLKPGLVLTVNPAITYGVFERLKSWRLADATRAGAGGVGPGAGKLGVAEAFWMGVISKTLATVVTYPYIFVGLFTLSVLVIAVLWTRAPARFLWRVLPCSGM